MKKILSLVLALVMALSLTTVAWGAPTTEEAALQAELNAGGTVTLTSDVTVNDGLTVPAGKSVVLDLNGKTLTRATETVNVLVNYGELTIKGNGSITTRNLMNKPGAKLVIDGDITIIGGASTAGSAIWNEGYVVINNVTIQQTNTTNYAIKNAAIGATLTINNATVTSKHGAVANDVGTAVINGGTFDVTGASTDHTIYAPNGGVTINGGTFKLSQPNASSIGSTIIDGAVMVNGGTFDAVDGALAYDGQTGLVIEGGIFTNKAAVVYSNGNLSDFVATDYEAVEVGSAGTLVVGQDIVVDADKKITGGTFADGVSAYVADNTAAAKVNDTCIVGADAIAAAATTGAKVTVVKGSVTLNNGTTLDSTSGEYTVPQPPCLLSRLCPHR